MTKINQSDLKFYPSERTDDTPEGGGLALGTPIQGVANEIFNPISTLARTNGNFNARLVYAGVQRPDDEPLIGSFVAITKPPKDPATSYLLFGANFGELRRDGIKRIENFNKDTIESPLTLLSNPAKGGKIIQAYQRVGESLPQVGDVYCLKQDKAGYPTLEQYIQIIKVESVERTFTIGEREFNRMVIKMEISQPLNHDFAGVDYPNPTYANAPTKIKETHVVDASRYYGIKPIVRAIKQGSMTAQVDSLMEQIVPTSMVETALVDINASVQTDILSDSSNEPIRIAINATVSTAKLLPIVPNTLSIDDITDNGGMLYRGGVAIGTVSYTDGVISLDSAIYLNIAIFKPATIALSRAESVRINIDVANRGYTYTISLPQVAIGSLKVSYMAQGKWYKLVDDGNGRLTGQGSGTINYSTGAVSITCKELPDVDSAIFFNWGNPAYQQVRHDVALAVLRPYQDSDYQTAIIDKQTIEEGQIVVKVSDNPLAAGSVELELNVRITENGVFLHDIFKSRLYDDGQGKLKNALGVEVGTVDYFTATARFNQAWPISYIGPSYRTESYVVKQYGGFLGLVPSTITQTRQIYNGLVTKTSTAHFNRSSAVLAAFINQTDGVITKGFRARLRLNNGEMIVPSSLVFMADGKLCYDKQGVIYSDHNPTTGLGVAIGSVGYATGVIQLKNEMTISLISLATTHDDVTSDSLNFALPTAPIRVGSFQVMATMADGTSINAIAHQDGTLSDEGLTGYIDIKTGAVSLDFGAWRTASEVQDEPWFSSDKVIDGKIWQPKQVLSSTVKYNAVATSHLPLDGEHIKIDTVRLPIDGRVPIFRRGDTILIGNRQTQSIGSAHSAGQTIQLERTNLDRICVMDNTGKAVNAKLWQYDLTAGTITWATPLDLSGYELPLKVMHAIEEKNRITEVDIDGTLSLFFGTRHDYPSDGTYVSSVLIGGDLDVKHTIPFTQKNWDNQWGDEAVGEPILNKLNLKDYPMVLTDDGTINEKWAIVFTSSNQFELYGETLGFVAKTDTLQNLAPINPSTGKPYFTIPKEAFGSDATWATRNLIRFNTEGSLIPLWVLRAVQPTNSPQEGEDGFSMCLFGDTTV